jgi:hypothetical protein
VARSTVVAPHRTLRTGTGHASNPARSRCETCGWTSDLFYGPAAGARALMAAVAHRRCPDCEGARRRPGGAVCDDCAGTGYLAMTSPDRSRLRRRRALQRRTPLRGGGELRRTGRVYSDRRLAELPAEREARREAVRAAGERDGWRCQAEHLVPTVACDGGLEGHEPLMRSRGGDPLDPDQIITTCAAHHRWAHANPTEAGEVGLLRHSWEGPIER